MGLMPRFPCDSPNSFRVIPEHRNNTWILPGVASIPSQKKKEIKNKDKTQNSPNCKVSIRGIPLLRYKILKIR